ncbi:unnamed protein product [Mytilus edulis]|uniref:Uncharacterized protein n=1 Tax=Mytilus edulis TaxID=6550 RepID=A0A8S3RUA9_MYTED|nr:unnamed protein product [Mytilus edulis]
MDVQSNSKSYEFEKGKVRGQLRSKIKSAAEEPNKYTTKKKERGIIRIADFNVENKNNDNDIRGCAIIDDNVVCFADRGNNCLIFMNLQGYQKAIKLICELVDIATVDQANITVAMYDNTIKIMNIESWKWDNFSFSDENTIGGLAFIKNLIFRRVRDVGNFIIDLSGKVQQTVTTEGSNMPYVSV